MGIVSIWPLRPARLLLPEHEVHVYVAGLDRAAGERARLAALLNPDEQARAARFYFDRDRQHYQVARGVLRTMLGRYLGIPPTAVTFTYGAHGKPELGGAQAGAIEFNISHAQGVALFGFARERVLGVDVERIRPLEDTVDIVDRFFSPNEVAVFHQVPPAQQPEAFFNCWTRKEAFIKAIGEGLSCPLHSFDVTLQPGEPAELLAVRGSGFSADHWELRDLRPAAGFAGAVIAAGKGWPLRTWQWP
jgi:4'-phosphopantetheinyl transferase